MKLKLNKEASSKVPSLLFKHQLFCLSTVHLQLADSARLRAAASNKTIIKSRLPTSTMKLKQMPWISFNKSYSFLSVNSGWCLWSSLIVKQQAPGKHLNEHATEKHNTYIYVSLFILWKSRLAVRDLWKHNKNQSIYSYFCSWLHVVYVFNRGLLRGCQRNAPLPVTLKQ